MSKNKQLSALNELGQSIWYDNLSRDVLKSGELKSLIETGVSGLTSNPTIFKKAIADTSDYDNDIKALSAKNPDAEALCEELMVQDVAAAADLLMPIYKASNGGDGYASIEVSPFLARDGRASIEAARRIWGKLNRPNIMIKIPGTPESLPAVRTALEEGINVNITLLFSVEMYEKVVEQYVSALETRMEKNQDLPKVASVASFFVSRVDAICEKNFDELTKSGKIAAGEKESAFKSFFGKVGVANAKVTYARYQELFGSPRFEKLKSKGARVQRPLWASTGTKNPELNPLLYIEELAGRDTVNTMPPATLKILLQKGNIAPKLYEGVSEARGVLGQLGKLGMDFNKLMLQLQDDGVELFATSYRELLDSIKTKQGALGMK
ncbi:MAG: transaldolase [Proteobacteria bacterium]|nr:MAG: transaldolase [Pseudomonadota bacterium]